MYVNGVAIKLTPAVSISAALYSTDLLHNYNNITLTVYMFATHFVRDVLQNKFLSHAAVRKIIFFLSKY